MSRWLRLQVMLLVIFAIIGCGKEPLRPPPSAPPEVSVSVPIERQIVDYEDFTGRSDAVYSIDIRPRVTGYLTKVGFKEGSEVRENDLLYIVDPRPYQAAYDQALGNLEHLKGQQILDDAQVARYEKLVPKGAASQQELDVYHGHQAENRGSMEAAKANVEAQKLNLDFCTMKAPIAGKISRTFLQIGNLVNADATVLTTLVSIDPMYVYFNVEETTLLRVQNLVRSGALGKDRKLEQIEVWMGLADDTERRFPFRGHVNFLNNVVDPLTGTITVRGVFENGERKLVPGLFARVRVFMGVSRKAPLVNERAIGTDQGQKFLYVVEEGNKARYRRVKVGQLHDGLRTIEEGLKPGERVVVNGLQRVRPGVEVTPELVDMTTLAEPGKPGAAAPSQAPAPGAKPEAGVPAGKSEKVEASPKAAAPAAKTGSETSR